jgi:NTP pyrophosphatase (non-canonical NTP hydrolase)
MYFDADFLESWHAVQEEVHKTARDKGWYEEITEQPDVAQDAMRIALMHEELSEALQGLRKDNPADDKIPTFSSIEAELADVVIRIMDFAEFRGHRVVEAILAKKEMNKGREYRHGGKAF